MTVWGEGQGEALLLSQVCKQNPMFAVPGCPWSGSSEAGWGEAQGASGGWCGARSVTPAPIPTSVTGPGPSPLPAGYLPASFPKDICGNLPVHPDGSSVFLELLAQL